MLRHVSLPAALVALMSTAAYANPIPVSDVRVEAELTTVDDAAAGRFWANLETDLTNAIASRITDQIADEGARVRVRIESVSLMPSAETTAVTDAAHIAALVTVSGNQVAEGYRLLVSIPESRMYLPDGAEVIAATPDPEAAYRTMVEAFADHVARQLG